MTRSQSGTNVYCACSPYKNRSRLACSRHSIKHNRLEAAVLFAIQQGAFDRCLLGDCGPYKFGPN
ncbi:MAG: hypothetical protein RSB03_05155 [Oscillospiraceae bacterium]